MKHFRPRVIPVLLLREGGLYKTRRFKDPRYVGDVTNALRIFNEKGADEIAVLDIGATQRGGPDESMVRRFAEECFMPLCYGGGISTAEQAARLIEIGVEKVSINSAALRRPALLREIADVIGSQSVVASIDARKGLFGGYRVYAEGGRRKTSWTPEAWAAEVERQGAGEIVINSIDHDGMMNGFDTQLVGSVVDAVTIPVVASGGAGNVEHMRSVLARTGASAVAAGSVFVFHGPHRAVLIQFPSEDALRSLYELTNESPARLLARPSQGVLK